MAIDLHDLRVVMSGGAGNTVAASSLGGAISTAAGGIIKSQTTTAPVNVTGVTIDDAYGNAIGVGSLKYTLSPKTLSWKPYGATAYSPAKTISGNGTYTIGGSNGYVIVTVVFTSLAAQDKTDSITVGNNTQNIFPNITAAHSLVGRTTYRCIYMKNAHSTDSAYGIKLWVKTLTDAEDEIWLGLDPAGINGTATTIGGDELTPPSGVTFSLPLTRATGISLPGDGNLDAGEYIAVWLKRIVPAESRGTFIGNQSVIAFSADI